MTTIDYLKSRWEILLVLVGLMSVGWYANAQVTVIKETQQIAKENTVALQETRAIVEAIVEERRIEKALEASRERIRVLEAALAAEGVIVTEVMASPDMEFETVAGDVVEESGEEIPE